MPLFDFLCIDCGNFSEILMTAPEDQPKCNACGSTRLKKLLSAPSSLSGVRTHRLPGATDTACCGSDPAHTGCAGPGSCCGTTPGRSR
jgi:putative FmdB family regulatory protein